MSKNIWIINEYAGSPYHGMEYRHYYLGEEFLKLGYTVTIISASYSHLFMNAPRVKARYTLEEIDGINYVWIKVNKYKSSSDKRRVLKWISFSFWLSYLETVKLSRPDAIILSVPGLFSVLPAYHLAKRNGAKFIIEVRDIWPLTLIELGGYSPSHPLIKYMRWCELFGLRKADHIVSLLPNYGQYLKDNKITRNFTYIPNGVNPDSVEDESRGIGEELKKIVARNKFIIGFTGTVGIANTVDVLIKSAWILKEHEDLAFVILGDGQEKDLLVKMSRDMNLKNVFFIPSVPKKQIQSILNHFNVCYEGSPKRKIYTYGVSPNKLFDYMFSAKPIIYGTSTKDDMVSETQCGISVESENPEAIAEAILKLKNMSPNEREEMGRRGREYVISNHSYGVLARRYADIL